ncbi:polysialyltransferase family glycosyltransferase [Streptomyces sp. NPDC058691]|uniref:polysialyltransferase family glycosyltransferase n=1 Tax=Streptomyces sp. NPDC058691 TaxID=3346601 RepID=UPI00366256EB
MIQIFFAATQYAAATVTAAVRAGLFGPREGHRRLLVVSNTSAIPELTTPLDRMAGFEELRPEFDAVHSWNETIAPHHPAGWSPREQDLTLWERALRLAWDIGDGPVEIACESLQANPSRAVAEIFAESTIHVYADGLMSYGPTRDRLPGGIACRIARLLHLDLLPGLRPLLLSEYGVEAVPIPGEPFLRTLSGIGAAAPAAPGRYTAVLLGQYLSALELISEREEDELHARMLRGAVAAGHTSVLFKPHPSAPVHLSRSLERAAAELGAELTVLDAPVLAETLFERDRPELVVGCFSTALITAASFYGIPAARVGTDLLLERISPYENSNRVPLTLIDAALPDLERDAEVIGKPPALTGELVADRLAPLIRAVGYCMQARAHPALRPDAEAWLTGHQSGHARYFKRRRLTSLRLPGGAPVRAEALRRHPAVRRIVRTLRAVRA